MQKCLTTTFHDVCGERERVDWSWGRGEGPSFDAPCKFIIKRDLEGNSFGYAVKIAVFSHGGRD